jgi:hypothetical protein
VNESAAGNNGQVGDPAGPYRVLDTATRRQAAIVYLVVAAFAVGLIAVSGVGAMWITAVAPLMMLAALQVAGGWRMRVRDIEAIRIASDHASFDVGHGAATLGFRGPLAKPEWEVLVFADGSAPDSQALVTVEALSASDEGRPFRAAEGQHLTLFLAEQTTAGIQVCCGLGQPELAHNRQYVRSQVRFLFRPYVPLWAGHFLYGPSAAGEPAYQRGRLHRTGFAVRS